MELAEGSLVFSRNAKLVQHQFEEEVFNGMEAAAKKDGVSVKEWIYNVLEENGRREKETRTK